MSTAASSPASNRPTPAASASASPAGEAPNVVHILRQYRWLLVAGTALGLIISSIMYFYLLKYQPRYSAEVQFQVHGEKSIIDEKNATPNSDELTRFMRRQFLVVTRDDVIADALKTEAFQRDYRSPSDTSRKSRWLTEHGASPHQDLQSAIEPSLSPSTDMFSIRLVGGDPNEVATQINAVADIYLSKLHQMELQDISQDQKDADAARKELEERVKQLSQQLDRYRVDHDVPGLIEQHTVILQTLGQLNSMMVTAEIVAKQAKDRYEAVKLQLESQTLQLPKETELQWVDNDMTMRNLKAYRMQMEQERSVSSRTYGPNHRNTILIDTRMAELDRQIEKTRNELVVQARQRLLDTAKAEVASLQADLESKRSRFEEEQRRVNDMDRAVTRYNVMQKELETENEHLRKVTEKQWSIDIRRLSDASRVKKFKAASPNPICISPKAETYIPGGLVIGFMLAFGSAYLLELTNTRVRTPRDIARVLQLPLLGFVPHRDDDALVNGNLSTCIRSAPNSMIAESFRQIRGSFAAQAEGQSVRTLLITSLTPGGGATTVASNLANGIALHDRKVLLIDANFYRPGLAGIYTNIPDRGLGDVLLGKATLDQVTVASRDLPTLHLMGVGTKSGMAPGELLESRAFQEILAQAREKYDLVIFDGAPLSLVAESLSLAAKLDGVVAVVRAGAISRGAVARIREQLKQRHAHLLGVVLNAAQTLGAGYFKQNYRTFYEYASTTDRPSELVGTRN